MIIDERIRVIREAKHPRKEMSAAAEASERSVERWALVDHLLWTAVVLTVMAGAVDLVRWIGRFFLR